MYTTRFETKEFYVVPTQGIYVLCKDLRTMRDYLLIQHSLIGSYN